MMSKAFRLPSFSQAEGEALSRREFIRRVGATAAAAWIGGLGLLSSAPVAAEPSTSVVYRPLADFLRAQEFRFVGWVWWDAKAANRGMFVDHWGTHREYLASLGIKPGTTVTGTVTERPLADGRAEITVVVHAKNAIAWATRGAKGYELGDDEPLLFGYLPEEIAASPVLTPALAEAQSRFVFTIEAPGAAIPDLAAANFHNKGSYPWFELRTASIRATAFGSLRAAFGVPEGTPGKATLIQVPGELIRLEAVGQ
jgi:hypothetical protein